MNLSVEVLNTWGNSFLQIARPILLQSSALILVVFAFDYALRRKVRAAIRYALWLVVLAKLILPPSFALPTSLAWWLRPNKPSVIPNQPPAPIPATRTVNLPQTITPIVWPTMQIDTSAFQPTPPPPSPPPPKLSLAAWLMLVSAFVSAGLLGWLLVRWFQVIREVRRAKVPSESLTSLVEEARRQAGLRRAVRLRLTERVMSPAVCGLFRPIVLLPQSLADKLPEHQLRAVLLHELIHLRRGDVWMNCAQALLQIAYWWHPLLWLANARIHRLREEAVDDAVMLALSDEADNYAPTLLEVAKLALNRPLMSLGLVGILESKKALRQRIERLVNFTTPRRAGLSVVSLIGIAAFSAIAVPMGEPPEKPAAIVPAASTTPPEQEDRVQSNTSTNESVELGILTETQFRVVQQALEQKGYRVRPGSSTNGPAELEADSVTYDSAVQAYYSRGSVVLRLPGRTMSAESAIVLPGEILASKATVQEENGSTITARRVRLKPGPTNLQIKNRGLAVPASTPGLYFRKFNVDTNTFLLNLQKEAGAGGSVTNWVQADDALLKVFQTAGMDFHTNEFKAAICEPDEGAVIIHSTLDDLIKIDRILARLGPPPPIPPPPSPQANNSPVISTSSGRQAVMKKLETLRLATISYNQTPLIAVVAGLSKRSAELDPEKEGIRFALNPNPPISAFAPNQPDTTNTPWSDLDIRDVPVTISPPLTNANLLGVLDVICTNATPPLSYSVREWGIVFVWKSNEPELYIRKFRVDTNVLLANLRQETGLGLNPTQAEVQSALLKVFQTAGMDFAPTNGTAPSFNQSGKAVLFNDREGSVMIRGTAEDLDKSEKILMRLSSTTPQPVPTNDAIHLPQSTPISSQSDTNLLIRTFKVEIQAFRAAIEAAGRNTANAGSAEAVPFDGEALKVFNFFKSLGVDMNPATQTGKAFFFTESNGLLLVRATKEDLDSIGAAIVKLNGEALTEIVQKSVAPTSSPVPRTNSVASGARSTQAASASSSESSSNLLTRAFKSNPDTLYEGLEGAGVLSLTNFVAGGGWGGSSFASLPSHWVVKPTDVQIALIKFFRKLGVDLDPTTSPGRSVFFNDRQGTLLVRATTSDLDLVEAAIGALNVPPQQIRINVKIVEVTQNDDKATGFDWYLGNFMMNKVPTNNAATGVQPTFTGVPPAINPSGNFPIGISPTDSTQTATSGVHLSATNVAASFRLTGILTEPQFRVVLRALQQRGGVSILNDSAVATLSGRQTQFQAVDIKYIATNVTRSASSSANPTNIQTTPVPFGPIVDIIPTVRPDGYTIQMTMFVSSTDFLGYDDPGPHIIQETNGSTKIAPAVLPHFRLRQVTTSAIVWDGQTIVLGGFISAITNQNAKINQSQKKNLMLFITPTLIDPAGNRIHTDDDLPSARDSIPPQPTSKP